MATVEAVIHQFIDRELLASSGRNASHVTSREAGARLQVSTKKGRKTKVSREAGARLQVRMGGRRRDAYG